VITAKPSTMFVTQVPLLERLQIPPARPDVNIVNRIDRRIQEFIRSKKPKI
jgi:hypothetical protein